MNADLKKIIVDAGGYSKVAEKLGTTKQVVWSWANVLGKVPPKWVNQLSELIKVPRYKIRPDLYPKNREL